MTHTLILTRLIFLLIVTSITGCVFFARAKLDGLQEDTSWCNSTETVYFLKRSSASDISLNSIRLNGNDEQKLVDGTISSFQFSRDGETIAFVEGNKDFRKNECGILNLSSKEYIILSSGCSEIDFHPNSELVSYVKERRRYSDTSRKLKNRIFVYNPSTNEHQQIFKSDHIIVGPRWSNNGEELFFNTLDNSRTYYSYNIPHNNLKTLNDNTTANFGWEKIIPLSHFHFNQSSLSNFSLSPSKKFTVSTYNGSLYVKNIKSNLKPLLVENIGSYNYDIGPSGFTQPVWSSSEHYIVGRFEHQLIVVDIKSGESGILTKGYNSPAVHTELFTDKRK